MTPEELESKKAESLARILEQNQAARAKTSRLNHSLADAFVTGKDVVAIYEDLAGQVPRAESEAEAGSGVVESPAHSSGDGPGVEEGPG